MESSGDIPSELLPLPNFANRPTSDIMLDSIPLGMWTFTLPSSSSDDENENKENRKPPQLPNRPNTAPSPLLQSKSSTESMFVVEESFETGTKIMDRPRFTARPRTASQGSHSSLEELPAQPRQTVHIKVSSSSTTKVKGSHLEKIIEDTLSIRNSPCLELEEPGDSESPPQSKEQDNPSESEEGPQLLPSIFHSEPDKKAADVDSMSATNTGVAHVQSRQSPKFTNSRPASPSELIKDQAANNLIIPESSSPKSATPTSPRTRSPSMEHGVRGRDTLREVNSAEDPEEAGQQRLYVPGPIRLEPGPLLVRKDSGASLEDFVPDTDTSSKGQQQLSDLVGVDSIVMFFEDFGGVEEVTASSFDQYWLRENQVDDRTNADNERKSDDAEAEDKTAPPKSPLRALRAPVSMFSFSTSSYTGTASSPETANRQRNFRLRKWLSPALPGSVILRSSTALV